MSANAMCFMRFCSVCPMLELMDAMAICMHAKHTDQDMLDKAPNQTRLQCEYEASYDSMALAKGKQTIGG